MEAYHKIVLAVAASILLLYLLTVGFMMRRDDSEKPWPPIAGRCPDSWMEHANVLNHCTPPSSGINTGFLKSKRSPVDFNKPYMTTCDKKKWANKWGVQWDGISNYNKCK